MELNEFKPGEITALGETRETLRALGRAGLSVLGQPRSLLSPGQPA